jgi:hypothetical protein
MADPYGYGSEYGGSTVEEIEPPFAKRLPVYFDMETDWKGFAKLLKALSLSEYDRGSGPQDKAGALTPYRVMEFNVESLGNGKVKVNNLRVDSFLLLTEEEIEQIQEEEQQRQTTGGMPVGGPRRHRGPLYRMAS